MRKRAYDPRVFHGKEALNHYSRGVLGRKAVLRASAFASPATSEPRRNLRPALACKERERRVQELRKLVEFRRAHAVARQRFAGGEHRVEFPPGTYRMRAWDRCAALDLSR